MMAISPFAAPYLSRRKQSALFIFFAFICFPLGFGTRLGVPWRIIIPYYGVMPDTNEAAISPSPR